MKISKQPIDLRHINRGYECRASVNFSNRVYYCNLANNHEGEHKATPMRRFDPRPVTLSWPQ